MLYLLKKVFARWLFPIPLCLGVLFIGLLLCFLRKQRAAKIMVASAGVILFLFSSFFFSDLLLAPLENRYPPLVITPRERASAGLNEVKFIVVLGAGISENAKRPLILRLDEDSITRLLEGVRLSKKLNCCKLVFTGAPGTGGLPSSAEAVAQLAQDLGVARQDIILEEQPLDTEAEAKLVTPIVGEQSFILVTEASHMPRAMALFRKQGAHPIPDPIDFRSRHGRITAPDLCPNAEALRGSERAVYEYLGLAFEKLRGQI
jgi:uncharacterized SAM-binding protein YcdF (DUF218 family)